jgi:transposase
MMRPPENTMNRMTDPPAHVTGGVDTHADVHVVAAICSISHQLLGTASFPASVAGYVRLLAWLAGFGTIDRVGIEGTGTYGAGLARFVTAEGIEVIEVDRPDRKARRQHGKSDTLDAEAAGRAVLSGRAGSIPKAGNGLVEAIRGWWIVYRSAIKDRTASTNRFHALVTTSPTQIREELQAVAKDRRIATVRRWRERPTDDPVAYATRQVLRELVDRIQMLTEQADRAYAQLDRLTDQAAPALRDVSGVGVCTAAQLLVTAGDNPQRLRSEAAFAHLCGVAPIPASSGKTRRHRLNQGGDRAANHALWRIAMNRRVHDQRTKDYFARRTTEGLSDRDIMRCLKRYIAREIHKVLTSPPPLAPRGHELRELRTNLGLPLRVVATAHGLTITHLSRIERQIIRNPALQDRIHTWLQALDDQPAIAA